MLGTSHGAEETEISIGQNSVEKAVELFKYLGFTKIVRSYQTRHNYVYKEVEISLKYSEHWNYHVELEIMTEGEKGQADAEIKIRSVADELGLTLLTNEETAAYSEKIIKLKATN